MTSRAITSPNERQRARRCRAAAAIDRAVAAAKAKTTTLMTVAHHPGLTWGTRAASDRTSELEKRSKAAEARAWDSTRVSGWRSRSGDTEMATNNNPIK